MWAFLSSELADTKALLNVVLALLRFQLLQSGVSEQEIDQTIAKWTAQYRDEAQTYAKNLLESALQTKRG